ncbi:uncharacterized protein FOMMEDRAFT_164640 [Fomitiporia mediterranea MF3/22]|uniref:uncharacterized protein n=1 Tax=Fomitiporia mediterranea (strain MF3/22) TaxID=694068 RepID=UPI00044080AE|nr:uncharacterized protein FOMMEDRAFT_164640 [Fomitiporia mediterranea MF3/22]EJD07761.1 hypothetical protein FOMMEDRAFT_164640 [Fomitiporia mediterranea MF3/22]
MENRQRQEGRHYSGQRQSGQATRYRSDVIGTNMASRSAEHSELGAASVSNFTSVPWPNTAASDSRGTGIQSYEPSPNLYIHTPSSVAGSVVSTYMHDDYPTVDPRNTMLNYPYAQHQVYSPLVVGDGRSVKRTSFYGYRTLRQTQSSHASSISPGIFPRRSSDSSLAGALGGHPSPSSPTSVVTPTTAGTSHSDFWIGHGNQPFGSGNEGPVPHYPPMPYQESIQGRIYDHAERLGTMHPGELQGASHNMYRSWGPAIVNAAPGQLDNATQLTEQAVHQDPVVPVPSTSSPRIRLLSTRENDASPSRNPRANKRARGSRPQPLRGTHVSTGLGPGNNMIHYGTVFTQNPGPSPLPGDTGSGSMNVRFKSEYPGRSTSGRPTATGKGKGRLILHEGDYLHQSAPGPSNQAETSSTGKKGPNRIRRRHQHY